MCYANQELSKVFVEVGGACKEEMYNKGLKLM